MVIDLQAPPQSIALCCPSVLTASLFDADAESVAAVFRALGEPRAGQAALADRRGAG